MKIIEIKGKEYSLRNESKEVTLNELAKISSILEGKDNKDFTDRWLEVLEILSGKELVEAITLKKFGEAVQSITITEIQNDIQEKIEVNGRTYSTSLDGGELELSAKDMAKIENLVKRGGVWGNKAFAVVYKDDQLTSVEHYTDAHIEHKAKLFGEHVTADIAAPVIFQLGKAIVLHIDSLVKASEESQTVEQEIETVVDNG